MKFKVGDLLENDPDKHNWDVWAEEGHEYVFILEVLDNDFYMVLDQRALTKYGDWRRKLSEEFITDWCRKIA
jgi:hypothetical protein